jgi:acyl-coenzyme A synthetase/AMP-(fatty) acid ligase/thioesterase domain-containing protein/acyl carrier protein
MTFGVPSSAELGQLDISERLNRLSSLMGDKVIVHSRNERLTFDQLNENASRVAQSLLEHLPSDHQYPVAILLNGGVAIISAIYGVLRAGHFYCAIAASEKMEQVERILKDLGPSILITEEDVFERVEGIIPSECRVLMYSRLPSVDASKDWPVVDPNAFAGIFYTSGSTGIPKGVLRARREIHYLIRVFGDHLGFRPNDHILAMRPFSTSASMVDVLGGIMNGAALSTYDIKMGGAHELAATLKSEKITIFRPPVQVMRSLLDLLGEGQYFSDIRLFFATGDVLYRKDVERIRKIIPHDALIIHQLASSEGGMLAVNKISHDTLLDDGVVPVGYPLPEQEILILNDDGGIISDHRVGEIAVCGNFTFPGYWCHPEWTDSLFIADPRGTQKTIMRTGDLGRFRLDGQLELQGRKDSRVKIRGFSVDLSAIENVLMLSAEVQRAVVIAVMNPQGQKRLVAYVLPNAGAQPKHHQLLQLVSSNLPDYMMPSLIMIVPELPIGATGKVDRKMLPAPRWERPQLSTPFAAPNDEIEEKLVAVWQKTLKVEQVGTEDNFFELGGDSLIAMHLLLAIEQEFSKKIPFTVISQASNIQQQAAILRKDSLAEYASVLIPVQPNGDKKPIYCIGGRGGLPIRFNHLLKYMKVDQPIYFFRSHGFAAGEQLRYTKEEIATDYIREIKRIQSVGPYHFLGESGGGLVAYEMAQQLQANGDEVGFLGMLDTKAVKRTYLGNFQPNPAMMVRKHFQTLTSGGFSGLKAYAKYYLDTLNFQIYQFQTWLWERRTRIRYGVLPEVFRKISEANATASRVYEIKPYSGTVVIFHASREAQFDEHGPDNGWSEVDVKELIIHPIDCYHGNILFEPFVRQVAEKINQYLP